MCVSQVVTTTVAVLALLVSVLTAWLTLFRRGRIRMTRPTIVAFAFDGQTPKTFLRFLLHCTAHRGNVIESMHVVLVQGRTRLLYSFWAYEDSPKSIVRGSGLFVSREGIGVNHHFVRPKDEAVTPIEAGICIINVYASILGQAEDQLLQTVHLNVSEEEAAAINNPGAGVIFDWNPESRDYRAEFH